MAKSVSLPSRTPRTRCNTCPAPLSYTGRRPCGASACKVCRVSTYWGLFAFVLPGRHASPTPRGLAQVLDLDCPGRLEAEVACLPNLAQRLLQRLAAGRTLSLNEHAAGLAARMGQAGWPWAPFVLQALGRPGATAATDGLMIWKRLPQWEDTAPLPPPASLPVSETEARTRLSVLLGPGAEQRQGQSDFAGAAAAAFAPGTTRGDPHLVLAEAGTGTGKTIGYIAPASLWAEKNRGTVWISTFTRHLQRQIDAELVRLFRIRTSGAAAWWCVRDGKTISAC